MMYKQFVLESSSVQPTVDLKVLMSSQEGNGVALCKFCQQPLAGADYTWNCGCGRTYTGPVVEY